MHEQETYNFQMRLIMVLIRIIMSRLIHFLPHRNLNRMLRMHLLLLLYQECQLYHQCNLDIQPVRHTLQLLQMFTHRPPQTMAILRTQLQAQHLHTQMQSQHLLTLQIPIPSQHRLIIQQLA